MEKQHSEFDKILCDLEDATKRTCELERKLEAQRQETACANDQLEKSVFLCVCVVLSWLFVLRIEAHACTRRGSEFAKLRNKSISC